MCAHTVVEHLGMGALLAPRMGGWRDAPRHHGFPWKHSHYDRSGIRCAALLLRWGGGGLSVEGTIEGTIGLCTAFLGWVGCLGT